MKHLRARFIYLIIIVLVIALGLLSRKASFIPLYVGDILWATMIFFIFRFLLIKENWKKVAVVSLLICFAVEASQLYQADWINSIRRTLPGRLVLGQGFLWTDLIAYTVGVAIGIAMDRLVFSKTVISLSPQN
jgi:hypothetical protein